jgi:Heparan-alpha-glucosaminide N-acetyltransferase, catalytic
MRYFHEWNLLAVHVPNLLPKTVPWFDFNWHHGFTYTHSHFPRKAGRLIWATVMFIVGVAIAMAWVRRPKRSNEPATWAQTFVGAMGVWVMLTLGYGVIPSEWIIFGNSYLNFDSSTFLLHRDQWASHLPPFDITRDKFVDAIAALIYVVVLVLNVYLFAAWQKRKVAEPATEGEETAPEPRGGPLARLRARREERVSAYGRPVTTTTEP